MAQKRIRGIESHQEVPSHYNRVDFRRPGEKFEHFMVEKSGSQLLLMLFLAIMFV